MQTAQKYLIEYLALHQSAKAPGQQFYVAYQVIPRFPLRRLVQLLIRIVQVVSNDNLIPNPVDLSPEGHGRAYYELIKRSKQEEWQVRFDKEGTLIPLPK